MTVSPRHEYPFSVSLLERQIGSSNVLSSLRPEVPTVFRLASPRFYGPSGLSGKGSFHDPRSKEQLCIRCSSRNHVNKLLKSWVITKWVEDREKRYKVCEDVSRAYCTMQTCDRSSVIPNSHMTNANQKMTDRLLAYKRGQASLGKSDVLRACDSEHDQTR
jgi:hypothetical protein